FAMIGSTALASYVLSSMKSSSLFAEFQRCKPDGSIRVNRAALVHLYLCFSGNFASLFRAAAKAVEQQRARARAGCEIHAEVYQRREPTHHVRRKAILKNQLVAVMTCAALTASTIVAQAEDAAYACVTTDNVGFIYNESRKRREQTVFHDQKFTAMLHGDVMTIKVEGKEEVYRCEAPWAHSPHLIQCAEEFYFITFDLQSLRFARSMMY